MSLTLTAPLPSVLPPASPASSPALLTRLAQRMLEEVRSRPVAECRILAELLPEVMRARQAAMAAMAMVPALARLGRGVAVLGPGDELVALNPELRAMLPDPCRRSDTTGRLTLDCAEADRALRVALGAARATAEGRIALLPDATAFRISRTDGTALAAHVAPVLAAGGGYGGAMLTVVDPARKARATPLLVQRTLGLPPADAHLAAAIARGETVAGYARARGVATITVRRRLAALRRRLNCRTDVDLALLVGQLAG